MNNEVQPEEKKQDAPVSEEKVEEQVLAEKVEAIQQSKVAGLPQEPVSARDVKEIMEETVEQKRLAGEKQTSHNSIDLALEQQSEEKGEEKEAFPSFFVDSDSVHRVVVDILFNKRNGNILSVSKANIGMNFDQFDRLGHTVEWFEFTQPSYEEMVDYRRRSSSFSSQAGQVVLDKMKLRDHYLVLHLKNWSLRDKNGNPVVLEHNENGILKNESAARVYKLSPVILDVVLTIFENDILIS